MLSSYAKAAGKTYSTTYYQCTTFNRYLAEWVPCSGTLHPAIVNDRHSIKFVSVQVQQQTTSLCVYMGYLSAAGPVNMISTLAELSLLTVFRLLICCKSF